MTEYNLKIRVVTASERPTHGFQIGQLLLDTTENQLYKLTAKGPHIWTKVSNASNVIANPVELKYGRCEFNGTTLRGEGLMAEMVPLGNSISSAIDATGTCQTFSAGTATIQNTGVAILRVITSDFSGLTRTNFLPYYYIKTVTNGRSSGDYRFYSGWFRNSVGPTVGETPLSNAQGGIIVGFNAADSEWNVWHSNGDGVTAVSKTPLSPSVAIPASATHYRVEMKYTTATNIVVTIYSSTGAVLGSATINTNVLASGKSLNWASVAQNPNTTNKTVTYYGAYMTSLL